MDDIWDWSFAFSVLPALLKATGVSLFAVAASFALALIVALPLAVARESRGRSIRYLSGGFVEFVRSTPILTQIYALYFALPGFGIVLPALATGVLALGVHYAAYISEVYRTGFRSVGQGQREAAAALGLSRPVAFLKIVMPQAIVPMIPMLGNYLIALYKETPLLAAIAIIEVMQTAKLIGSETFRYNEPITIAGLIFLVLSIASARVIAIIERRATKWR
ncbi:ectoine/hydroxyectoine ABC transporter permease subunit EhuD [Bosea sp. (in: a-proteobacteria)]|uniref:ectoine/hydroxyectoine ABC transporter permease subunit EhuD n=1 Tax=Bosea sp. (in: a-proteobacteria) TaxID=1871050 RepID=UPI00260AFCA5|nr:ectoine/hydroxyectoine ABC transporter permease subunit EhuD [Bosea sp. (in: a-proteobacteria)]MCO5089531.1 ectoine/hydroxyectoine ABC transporter permease subunit EhuD [Bosea sp. (in: a-proteobacteria)]